MATTTSTTKSNFAPLTTFVDSKNILTPSVENQQQQKQPITIIKRRNRLSFFQANPPEENAEPMQLEKVGEIRFATDLPENDRKQIADFDNIANVRTSNSGKYLAAVGDRKVVTVWNFSSGEHVLTIGKEKKSNTDENSLEQELIEDLSKNGNAFLDAFFSQDETHVFVVGDSFVYVVALRDGGIVEGKFKMGSNWLAKKKQNNKKIEENDDEEDDEDTDDETDFEAVPFRLVVSEDAKIAAMILQEEEDSETIVGVSFLKIEKTSSTYSVELVSTGGNGDNDNISGCKYMVFSNDGKCLFAVDSEKNSVRCFETGTLKELKKGLKVFGKNTPGDVDEDDDDDDAAGDDEENHDFNAIGISPDGRELAIADSEAPNFVMHFFDIPSWTKKNFTINSFMGEEDGFSGYASQLLFSPRCRPGNNIFLACGFLDNTAFFVNTQRKNCPVCWDYRDSIVGGVWNGSTTSCQQQQHEQTGYLFAIASSDIGLIEIYSCIFDVKPLGEVEIFEQEKADEEKKVDKIVVVEDADSAAAVITVQALDSKNNLLREVTVDAGKLTPAKRNIHGKSY